jgi:hypothetical protein
MKSPFGNDVSADNNSKAAGRDLIDNSVVMGNGDNLILAREYMDKFRAIDAPDGLYDILVAHLTLFFSTSTYHLNHDAAKSVAVRRITRVGKDDWGRAQCARAGERFLGWPPEWNSASAQAMGVKPRFGWGDQKGVHRGLDELRSFSISVTGRAYGG